MHIGPITLFFLLSKDPITHSQKKKKSSIKYKIIIIWNLNIGKNLIQDI